MYHNKWIFVHMWIYAQCKCKENKTYVDLDKVCVRACVFACVCVCAASVRKEYP